MKKKIYIIAGESSGDFIGAKLIEHLKLINPNIEFYGIGATFMEEQGLRSLFPVSNIAIMGFFEVIKKVFFLKNKHI